MTQLKWNHALSVGVRILDQQHGVLLDTLNQLSVGIAGGAPANEVRELIERLVDYTQRHFQSEEALMEQYGFPGRLEHQAEHQRLLAQIVDAARAMQLGEPVHLRTMVGYVRQWFVTHTEGIDRVLGEWLNQQGVE